MTGQFFFDLLNPAVALLLAATFGVLSLRQGKGRHLSLVALTFALAGIAFVLQDFFIAHDGPALRIAVNGLFYGAILLACCAALMVVDIEIPGKTYALVTLATALVFCWFIFWDPSLVGRIHTVNAAFTVLALITGGLLLAARPKMLVHWLFVALAACLLMAALARPVAMMLNGLDIGAGGSLQNSVYWATVQALTPVVAIAIAIVFLVGHASAMMGALRNEAERDFLTGLLNRRGFDARVTARLEISEPRVWQSAVMLADIDDFKKINDSFGHAVGDTVIAAVGTALVRAGRAELVGRMGGEEFALFYADARRGDLLDAADAIRAALTRVEIDGLPYGYPLTISMGIHTRHQSETLSTMMRSADQALYAAKIAGKNRAVLAPLPIRTVVDQPRYMAL